MTKAPYRRFEDELSADELTELRGEVRRLSRLQPWRSFAALVFDWAIIAAAIFAAVSSSNVVVSIFAIVVIGARQNALGRIMHEGSHDRLSNSRWLNAFLADWFCAFPLFTATAKFKGPHLAHHRFLNTEQDPDMAPLHKEEAWSFPQPERRLLRTLGRQIFLMDAFEILKSRLTMPLRHKQKASENHRLTISQIAFYSLLVAALAVTQSWNQFFIYWILPGLVVVPLLLRLRLLAEHYGLEFTHEITTTRNVKTGVWGRFFVMPHASNYHLAHHLFPSVPFYSLAELQTALERIPFYAKHASSSDGLIGSGSRNVWSDLTKELKPI